MKNILYVVVLFSIFINTYAASEHTANEETKIKTTGLGEVAENLMEPVKYAFNFVQTGCFVLGTSFLFAALIKYIEHRRSPLMVPISTVIFLIIAGIILILLPFLSLITESGLTIK